MSVHFNSFSDVYSLDTRSVTPTKKGLKTVRFKNQVDDLQRLIQLIKLAGKGNSNMIITYEINELFVRARENGTPIPRYRYSFLTVEERNNLLSTLQIAVENNDKENNGLMERISCVSNEIYQLIAELTTDAPSPCGSKNKTV